MSPPFCKGEMTKKCKKCGEAKPLGDFYKHNGNAYRSYCKSCWTKHHSPKARQTNIKRFYGIDEETYNEMLAEQGGGCAICGRSAEEVGTRFKHLAVDHNHDTGLIRGLLCTKCNTAIGLFEDDVDRLSRAIEYIRSNQ